MSDETPKTNIRVTVDRTPEMQKLMDEKDALRNELEEKKGIITQQALTEFEKHKQALSERFNDPAILELSGPTDVANYIANSEPKTQNEKPHAPYGRAPPVPPARTDEFESKAALVDELYKIGYYDTKATPEQRADARQKINTLWTSFEKSKTLAEIHENPKSIVQIMQPKSECPACHRTLSYGLSRAKPECEFCGYDVTQKNANYRTQVPVGWDSRNMGNVPR